MFYLYKWDQLIDHSPCESVRNEWLYHQGGFACYQGIWFPCNVIRMNTVGTAATIQAKPPGKTTHSIYPTGEITVKDCDYYYTVFPDGMPIKAYIQKALTMDFVTDKQLFAALRRSLNTELLHAPKRIMSQVKKAANASEKGETYVIDSALAGEIGVIPLPRTVDIVEKLWNSKDWAMQEVSQMLGMSYNPSHGKKERMINSEMLGDRDLIIMNRERITSLLIEAAERYGEKVMHISTKIDIEDRELGKNIQTNEGEPGVQ